MQDAEIKATCQEIANFDYESDLAGGCQKIVGRTHRLLNSNDMLRDALEKALAEVAQQESRPPEEADRSDPLTGCVNRAGIEADLNTWWASVADHTRLCVAMIDIDRLAETNEQFGYRAGNEILKAIAKLLEANRSDNVQVARFSGQRFLVDVLRRGNWPLRPIPSNVAGRRSTTPTSSTRTSTSASRSVAR